MSFETTLYPSCVRYSSIAVVKFESKLLVFVNATFTSLFCGKSVIKIGSLDFIMPEFRATPLLAQPVRKKVIRTAKNKTLNLFIANPFIKFSDDFTKFYKINSKFV